MSILNTYEQTPCRIGSPEEDWNSRLNRNEREDVLEAVGYIFDLGEKLKKCTLLLKQQ